MAFEYHFEEFDPGAEPGDIREWLAKMGDAGWEAIGFTSMTHVAGGGLIGGISIPSSQSFGYTFLMKRAKAN